MSSSNSILVPTRYSEMDAVALSQSYNLAKKTNSKLVLLNVIATEPSPDDFARLDKIAEAARKESGLEILTKVLKGKVFEKIIQVAEEMKPLFIIFGLDNQKERNKIFGDNAFKLLSKSPSPVITIHGKNHKDGCQNIVLPLDHTKETREKVGKAIEFAKLFDAKIRVVSVLATKEPEYKKKVLMYSKQTLKYIAEKGVRCTMQMLEGTNIAELVVNYAKEVDGDLILIMTQEEVGIKDFFVGTSAQQVINSSPIPVLSVRPTEKKDTMVLSM